MGRIQPTSIGFSSFRFDVSVGLHPPGTYFYLLWDNLALVVDVKVTNLVSFHLLTIDLIAPLLCLEVLSASDKEQGRSGVGLE